MLLKKPTVDGIRSFMETQTSLPFSYTAVGATAQSPPLGFVVDHTRLRLGAGPVIFRAATEALRRWEHFQLGWVEAWPRDTPIQVGEVVSVVARSMGFWWLNCCRIVYVVDIDGPVRRFGFAYGTLPGHVERGEERFLIEWNTVDDTVWYDILAFSRPNHVLAKLGYPLVRRVQKRFARDSASAMQRAVHRAEVHGEA